jgi:hypothetical protein
MSTKGKEDIGVGVPEIDSEHDLMLGLVRALDGAVAAGTKVQVEALCTPTRSSRATSSSTPS